MKKLLLILLLFPLLSFSQDKNEIDFSTRIGFIKEMKTRFKDETSLKFGNLKGNSLKFLNFSDEKILELKKIFKIQVEQLIQKFDAFTSSEKEKELEELSNLMYSNEIETRKLFDDKQLELYLKNFVVVENDKTKPMNIVYLCIFISDEYLKNYKVD